MIIVKEKQDKAVTTAHFKEFSETQQAEYQKYAEEHWDSNLVRQSYTRWHGLTDTERKALLKEGEKITLAIAASMPSGVNSPETQSLIAEWHRYINRFYDCSIEIFRELGKMYLKDARFAEFYSGIAPQLPEFLAVAIYNYCEKHTQEN